MVAKQVIFSAGDIITPDLAAKIAQCASMYEAEVYLRYGEIALCVDSLIGILAMGIHNGSRVMVRAEGSEAEKALAGVCDILTAER